MKKFILILSLLMGTLAFGKESDILGKWITEKADNGNQIIVQFHEENNKFYGIIDNLTIPVYGTNEKYSGKKKMDLKNPNPSLRSKTLVGSKFVYNFTYNRDKNKLEDGSIYNPENGKTYHCSITFKNINTIIVKGSLDSLGLIGKKQIWKRVK